MASRGTHLGWWVGCYDTGIVCLRILSRVAAQAWHLFTASPVTLAFDIIKT